MADDVIEICDGVFIRGDELCFKFSRSGGPGGQHVNKVSTRVEVFFDVAGCDGLDEGQKKLILGRLATRADKNGVVKVASRKFRSQIANRRAAVEKLVKLLGKSLETRAVRKKTRVPAAAKRKRLEEKKRRGEIKKLRGERF